MAENVFEKLNKINVNDKTEKKNGLTYLSWAWAWGEVKKLFPDATYGIYENEKGWNYFTDGRTCWVKTGVTIEGIEHIEYLPVMDYKNRSIAADAVTSFDVNKAIQRSLTKAIARHGLGLYIYAGEDLPEEEQATVNKRNDEIKKSVNLTKAINDFKAQVEAEPQKFVCADCGVEIADAFIANGTKEAYGRTLCKECGLKAKRAKGATK
jgi:hypothetical protein